MRLLHHKEMSTTCPLKYLLNTYFVFDPCLSSGCMLMSIAKREPQYIRKTNKLLQIASIPVKEVIKIPGVRGAIWTR